MESTPPESETPTRGGPMKLGVMDFANGPCTGDPAARGRLGRAEESTGRESIWVGEGEAGLSRATRVASGWNNSSMTPERARPFIDRFAPVVDAYEAPGVHQIVVDPPIGARTGSERSMLDQMQSVRL